MHRVLVLGAGKIGALISGLLADAGNYQVQLADVNADAACSVARDHGLHYFDLTEDVEGKTGRQRSRAGAIR